MAFNTANFARMPASKIGHSLFKRPFIHAGTMMHGDIVPIYCKLVSPGEVIKEHLYGNIRMSQPVSPLYSSIKVSFNAFFVPLRLVWEHTKEFFGENTSSAGVQTTQYHIPMQDINDENGTSRVNVHSVSHYLGKPLFKGSTLDSGAYDQKVSILKERAYWLTISEWYRQEQVMNPVLLNVGDSGSIGTLDGVTLNMASACAKCLKDFDYFTTMTRSPVFGPDVSLPLGTTAPVFASNTENPNLTDANVSSLPGPLRWRYVSDATTVGVDSLVGMAAGSTLGAASGAVQMDPADFPLGVGPSVAPSNLKADLRLATAATIDELYLAMAAQAWYHNSNFGSRYFEMLQIHYSVTNPDLVLQRPEHIGEAKRYIQVQQVLSTAGATNDNSTKLGQPGANSSTNIDVKFPRHSFGEWGYFIILANTYHEHYYTAGFQREDLYSDMFDFFFPEFSNIGDMSVLRKELFSASSLDPTLIVGYQEAWSEMRYSPNRLSGLFDPYVDGTNSSGVWTAPLKGWVLSEKWSSAPTLSKTFLLENRDAISSVLTTSTTGPDYLFYFYFDEKTLSEVPVYSKPGLPGRGRGIL